MENGGETGESEDSERNEKGYFITGHSIGKKTQFSSENQPKANGRKPGKSISTILKEMLENGVTVQMSGQTIEINSQTLALNLLATAFKPDAKDSDRIKAMTEAIDRIEGKSLIKQEIKIEQEPDKMRLDDGTEIDV